MSPPPDTRTLVELARVTVRAGARTILTDAGLHLRSGELVGVVGPNGAGKSTLLGVLNATISPTTGDVRHFGANTWKQVEGARCRLRARMATVLQRGAFDTLPPLTVRDVVLMGRTGRHGLAGRLNANDHHRAAAAMENMEIETLADRPFRELSGGEQQKVQLARAMAQEPELLLLDEPATGLDLDWQERMTTMIGRLFQRTGIPVVMTTHHVEHLPASITRVLLMHGGRVRFDGAPETALTAERLSDLYGCAVEVEHASGRRRCRAVSEGAT